MVDHCRRHLGSAANQMASWLLPDRCLQRLSTTMPLPKGPSINAARCQACPLPNRIQPLINEALPGRLRPRPRATPGKLVNFRLTQRRLLPAESPCYRAMLPFGRMHLSTSCPSCVRKLHPYLTYLEQVLPVDISHLFAQQPRRLP